MDLILTKQQVNKLNIASAKHSEKHKKRCVDIIPVELANGDFVIPVAVLENGEFNELFEEDKIKSFIDTVEKREVKTEEYKWYQDELKDK